MPSLDYICPTSLAEVAAALAAGEARLLAGGTDLIPQMRAGRRPARRVVDVKRVAALTGIELTAAGGLWIGAAAPVARLHRDAAIGDKFPAIAESCRMIGSLQIQNRASLGGNICNGAPSADGVPALIALGAEAEVFASGESRLVSLASIFAGPGRTTLAHGEILVAIHVPPQAARNAAAYVRFTPRREMDIAVAGAGVSVTLDAAGRVCAARCVLASVAPVPLEVPEAAAALVGEAPTAKALAEAGRIAARLAKPISDTRGSAAYRRALVEALTARAYARALGRLGIEVEVP